MTTMASPVTVEAILNSLIIKIHSLRQTVLFTTAYANPCFNPKQAVYFLNPIVGHSHKLPRGPFLERPGNLTGPKTYFEIKVSRRVGCVLTSIEVHFVSLADNLTVPFSKLLKLPSFMENKTA